MTECPQAEIHLWLCNSSMVLVGNTANTYNMPDMTALVLRVLVNTGITQPHLLENTITYRYPPYLEGIYGPPKSSCHLASGDASASPVDITYRPPCSVP